MDCSSDSVRAYRILRLCRRLQSTTVRKKKVELVEKFPHKGMLRRIFALTMDPQVHFGFTSATLEPLLESKEYSSELYDADTRLKAWVNTLTSLSKNTFKGDAVGTLLDLLDETTYEERTLLLSILDKRLNVGIDFATAQRLFGRDFVVLPKDFMKAGLYETDMDIDFPVIAEPLIDGGRFKLVVTEDGECQAYDSSFATNTGFFQPFFPALQRRAAKLKKLIEVDVLLSAPGKDWGYVYALLYTRGKSYEEQREELRVYVLDVVVGDNTDTAYSKRRDRAVRVATDWKTEDLNVRIVPCVEVNSRKELMSRLKSVKSSKGLIIKDPESPYCRKRDTYWLKVRPENLVVFNATVEEMIYENPKNPNTLTGLILKSEDGTRVIIKQFRGTKQRLIVAEWGQSLIGRAVEYELDPQGDPIFKRWRPRHTVNG